MFVFASVMLEVNVWYRLSWNYEGLYLVDGTVKTYVSTGSTNVVRDSDTSAVEWACAFVSHLRDKCLDYSLTRIALESAVVETVILTSTNYRIKLEQNNRPV
jgi:hypothetical protein